MKAIIHVHSKYSFDSLTPPEKLVDLAVKNSIDVLCITDHDTIKGSVHARQYAEKKYNNSIKIIIGAEYKTDCGDLIGLNLTEEIKLTKADEVIKAIHAQEGIVLLPHPLDSHKNLDFLAEQADVIEVFNSRSSFYNNKMSMELADSLGKPDYVASDAHFLSDAALCINQFHQAENLTFQEALMTAQRSFFQKKSSQKHYFQSQIIAGLKKRKPRLLISALKNWINHYDK